ncbi:MAG: hypothetical protein MZU97_25145 [Bacillus subtilis]|nr:hypothetical protein [Bacillus subtilis]
MKQLGNTLESIAMNKLGIVKQGVPLVTTEEQPRPASDVFTQDGAKQRTAAIQYRRIRRKPNGRRHRRRNLVSATAVIRTRLHLTGRATKSRTPHWRSKPSAFARTALKKIGH